MKVLKGLAISLLGFLLFLSLSSFGLAFTMKSTVLNPRFVIAETDKLDIVGLAKTVADRQLSQLPPDYQFAKQPVLDSIPVLEPWIREQMRSAINSGYDYLLGKTDQLRIVVSLDQAKATLRDRLYQALLKNPPPQLASVPPAQLQQYFDQFYQQIAAQIPSTYQITSSSLPPGAASQLGQVRQYVGQFLFWYNILIIFMIVLVAGIVLILRNVREAARNLGVTFLSYGALEFAGIIVGGKYLVGFIPQMIQLPPEIPPSLMVWVQGLIVDMFRPLVLFSLVCAVGGAILIIVSFFFAKRATE